METVFEAVDIDGVGARVKGEGKSLLTFPENSFGHDPVGDTSGKHCITVPAGKGAILCPEKLVGSSISPDNALATILEGAKNEGK